MVKSEMVMGDVEVFGVDFDFDFEVLDCEVFATRAVIVDDMM